ncbi:hypothetical protein I6N98_02010 [Spongiibacter nanhainus]|uniref:Uncharacterized protein n=1 Tax=Spongiibacter nanhainus TaxID=2794344 RepID=A0A7T4R1S2_9GAMM|nr:hypothetical protein [Spongiibacter nanhainus]QQD18672.1 hypothetical protein I6N98_02010 [Spongiibacter nanhainus]
MLTFAVLQTLENDFGAKGGQLMAASAAINQYLLTPRQASVEEWVFVPLAKGGAQAAELQCIPVLGAGWIIDVAKERQRIDVYLGVIPPQQELPLISDAKSSR